jgi:outer membrane protein assembly factor BamB
MTGAALAQFPGPAPLAWRWAQPTSVAPLGSPLVVGDTVYVAVGSRVFALDRATGNQKWKYPQVEGIPGYFRSAPVLAEGTIVAAGDNRLIYGVDAATGAAKWQYASEVPIVGQPVALGNIVVARFSDNSIMGIRADNGQPEWKAPNGEPLPYRVFDGIDGDLAVHGNTILFVTQAGELQSVSAATRKLIWKAKFSSVTPGASPIIYGDVAFVNSGTWLVAVNAINGGARWQQNIGEMLAFSPAVSAEGVFTVTQDGKGLLFDTATGRVKMRNPIDLGSVLAVRPSAIDKQFLAPLTSGALTLVNPANGEVTWSYLVRPLFRSASTGGGGGQPLGGGGGAAGGVGPPGGGGATGGGGTQSSTQPIAIPASGPGVLAGQTLLILMQDGSLLAFDRSAGVDKTGPNIAMVWPNPGDQVSGQPPLELIFKIDDEATGVNSKTVSVKVAGQDMEVEYGRDGFAIVRISPFNKNKPLMNGRKAIVVTATDWFGNATTAEYGLTIDNALAPLARQTTTTGPTGGNPGRGGGRGGGIGGDGG